MKETFCLRLGFRPTTGSLMVVEEAQAVHNQATQAALVYVVPTLLQLWNAEMFSSTTS